MNITPIEGFDGETLHPSLDIKNGILVLGFRYKTKIGKEEDLILLVHKGNIEILSEDSIVIEGKEYSIERRGRRLIRIQERWGIQQLNRFREERVSLQTDGVPKPKELFEEIKATIRKYVELERDIDYSLTAAWIIGTYFHPLFHAYPFLNAKAPKHSGKSQFLNLLGQLCFNAVKSQPTLAALGDTVDALRGTYLIDQADSLGRKGTEQLLDILADSYKRSGGKRRIVEFDKNRGRSVVEYETYGPKVFASIRELPEDLRDRCLIVPLLRSQRNFSDPDEESDLWSKLRDGMYRLLIGIYAEVSSEYILRRIEYKRNPEKGLVGRPLELWLPFETILRFVGAETEVAGAKERFLSRYGFAESEPSDLEHRVIEVILKELEEQEKITLSPKEIVPFVSADLFLSKSGPNQMAATIGWTIKKFNLSSGKGRSGDGVYYIFEKQKVEAIYRAYFPTSPAPDAPGPSDTGSPADVGGDV